jgi:hypothetical protein
MLDRFASTHNLKIRRDECGDPIVSGKHGHIYEADGRLGVCLLDNRPSLPTKARTLLNLRRKALAAGFTPHQLGEAESILLFDPEDKEQASLAIRLVRAKAKRTLTPERRAALFQQMARVRQYRTGS